MCFEKNISQFFTCLKLGTRTGRLSIILTGQCTTFDAKNQAAQIQYYVECLRTAVAAYWEYIRHCVFRLFKHGAVCVCVCVNYSNSLKICVLCVYVWVYNKKKTPPPHI